MPKLLAIIAEDGWSMVRDGETIFFLRPPFRASERVPVPESTLADAVALHGYAAVPEAPEEPWANVIERIQALMARVSEGCDSPSNDELLFRLLQNGPPSVLTALLDKVEHEWLARRDMRSAERALAALFAERRGKKDEILLNRALALRERLDKLRAEKEARVPVRQPPQRIQEITLRPGVDRCKANLKRYGSASMVSPGT